MLNTSQYNHIMIKKARQTKLYFYKINIFPGMDFSMARGEISRNERECKFGSKNMINAECKLNYNPICDQNFAN